MTNVEWEMPKVSQTKNMVKDVFEAIAAAALKMITNWGALLITLLLYLLLLSSLYLFFTTREATTVQVLLTLLVLPIASILVFFLLQAMGLSYVRIGVGPGYLLKRALNDCWKLLLVSLPIILLAWLIVYLTNQVETYLVHQVYGAPAPVGKWRLTALEWVKILLLYFVLPLIAIHLWIATVREGIGRAFRNIGHSLARAFAPRSVLT